MAWYIESDEREEPLTKNTLPRKALIQIQQRNQKLHSQAKAKRIHHHQTSFPQMLKELLMEKKRSQTETRKLRMENFTVKCKHTVKVGNNPHTNMILKLAIVRRG